jgi:hypothetical protein
MALKRCPKCGRLYAEEAQICEDCEGALVETEKQMPGGSGDIIPLTTVAGQAEAMVLTNVLEAEGIQAIVEDLSLLCWTAGSSTPMAAGGIRVLVNSEDAEAALEVLEEHKRGELALTDEDEPEPAE